MNLREKLIYQGEEPFLGSVDRDAAEGVAGGYSRESVRLCYTVECNVSGRGAVIVNNKRFPLGPGDCYLLLPGDRVVYYSDPACPRCGIWCYVGGGKIANAIASSGVSSDSPILPREMYSEIYDILCKMLELSDRRDLGAEYRRTALVYEILAVITGGRSDPHRELWLKQALRIMESVFYTDISVSDLARAVGLERSYFSTLFKQRVGTTPHAYLTKLRIAKARELLLSGAGVSEAAESVGLDPRNFARRFCAETGMSPTEFKNTHSK